jgi:hypothetical protein
MRIHIAGALNSDGSFSGNLKQYGCRSSHSIKFSGRVKNNEILAEFFTSARGNPPEMSAKKLQSILPIRKDGSFGDSEDESSRFWLRYRPSGGPKYQWLSGKVLYEGVYIRLTFGSPKYPSSFCKAEGLFSRHKYTNT